MMSPRQVQDEKPWYQQFWPWFLISLPATVVVAGIITLIIAVKNDDSLVADNYYKQGLAINQQLAADRLAEELELVAILSIDDISGEVLLQLRSDGLITTQELRLLWQHPINGDKDFSLTLKRNGAGQYIGQLPQSVSGRWYVALTGSVSNGEAVDEWRIKAEVQVSDLLKGLYYLRGVDHVTAG